MRNLIAAVVLIFAGASSVCAKTAVFWQDGFPTVASEPISRQTLVRALDGMDPTFVGLEGLKDPATLKDVELLVLPYGSSVPADAWESIHRYLRAGGNLLVVGGQPFRVPVSVNNGKFTEGSPQDSYSRVFDFRHTYEVPRTDGARFAWKFGYSFLPAVEIRARRLFAVEGPVEGLGYLVNGAGDEVAAPVIVADHTDVTRLENALLGSRFIMLDFEPEPGY